MLEGSGTMQGNIKFKAMFLNILADSFFVTAIQERKLYGEIWYVLTNMTTVIFQHFGVCINFKVLHKSDQAWFKGSNFFKWRGSGPQRLAPIIGHMYFIV